MKPHPRVRVRVAVGEADYELQGFPAPAAQCTGDLDAITDTGAMMVVIGIRTMGQLGVWKDELLPTTAQYV